MSALQAKWNVVILFRLLIKLLIAVKNNECWMYFLEVLYFSLYSSETTDNYKHQHLDDGEAILDEKFSLSLRYKWNRFVSLVRRWFLILYSPAYHTLSREPHLYRESQPEQILYFIMLVRWFEGLDGFALLLNALYENRTGYLGWVSIV